MVLSAIFAAWISLVALQYTNGGSLLVSLAHSTYAFFLHILCACSITAVYRISPFHPMASFPGPLLNKLTTLTLLHTVSTGKRHLIIEALHKKYGVFVRTGVLLVSAQLAYYLTQVVLGPNTLSINSLEAVGPIYSSAQCFNRSEGYRPGRFGDNSLFFIRDRQRHNIRRRVWAGAFTPAM